MTATRLWFYSEEKVNIGTQRTLFQLEAGTGPLKEKKGVCLVPLAAKSILNYCDTTRMPDTFTINPYRGCEFGCTYCYARYTHEFMQLEGDQFDKKIFVKLEAAKVLLRSFDQAKVGTRPIAIGTATDPYQPAESRYRITQGLLEIFSEMKGLRLSVTTKSALVQRDISLLAKIAAKNQLQVNISLISLDPDLIRCLEPKASTPRARLRALRALRQAGIEAGLFVMPILPGLTDDARDLEMVVKAARQHGASYVGANLLFLRDASRKAFYAFLKEHYPSLHSRYQRLYGRRSYAESSYRHQIGVRMKALRQRYGFETRPSRARSQTGGQRELWG